MSCRTYFRQLRAADWNASLYGDDRLTHQWARGIVFRHERHIHVSQSFATYDDLQTFLADYLTHGDEALLPRRERLERLIERRPSSAVERQLFGPYTPLVLENLPVPLSFRQADDLRRFWTHIAD